MQTTNKTIPTISSARIPGARKAAAVSSPSKSKSEASNVAPPELEKPKVFQPPLALEGWGLASYSSSDEEEEPRAAKPAAAKKHGKSGGKQVKGRAPSRNKYLLPAQPPANREDSEAGDKLMSGPAAAAAFGDVPSSFDPFADAERADDAAAARDVVHLRVQQRNGRKTLTTVQGLGAAYNYDKILRDLKRELCCSGVVLDDEDLGKIIQLQGDHRKRVGAFLVKAGMATKDNVKIHGY